VKDKILPNAWKNEEDDIQLRNEEGIRKMTPREWARLQGFPDSFKFPVSMTQTYKQLGNSVAVPVINAIAEQMKSSLEEKNIIKIPDLDKKQKEVLNLLERMFVRNEFTKTGVKYIKSIENFIDNQYLRISNLENLIQIMERHDISKKINENQLKFSKRIIKASSKEDFLKKLIDSFKKSEYQLVLTEFS
ncbi:MAG: hypothetical protein GF383_10365, partial [Candidatus Lokiarchaeota archaeon]|nr:hypothetical protein [Candidatus Lokiarchaeota archaeon]MBD3340960.1 hypothetical protein [Candidatus Lokiarchaeota archaeon]